MARLEGDHRTGSDKAGYYIRTFTGKQFYWETVEDNEYDIRDIAHALSMNCRWTGHVREFYSVAQHSVYASYEVPAEHAMAALLHDASEAYVHDTPSPLKWYLKEHHFNAFARLETRIDIALNKSFGVAMPRAAVVKEVDLRLLSTEKRDLMPKGGENDYMLPPYEWHVQSLLPKEAETLFLRRFHQIKGD